LTGKCEIETSRAGSCRRVGSATGKPVNGLMVWDCKVGSIVPEEEAIGDSMVSVVLVVEVAVEVVAVGISGAQFPSPNDIKMINKMEKRCDITVRWRRRGRLLFLKALSYTLICIYQCLWQYACLSQCGHKVGVTIPARDNMNVNMSLHACTRGFPHVCAHIEGLRIVYVAQDGHATRGQFHHFCARLWIEFLKIRLVVKRDNHQMAAGIGIAVQNHIRVRPAKCDEILRAIFLLLRIAKDTPIFFMIIFDIFHTPWRPDMIHRMVEL
jgi:hypothetical protein